MNVYTLTNAFVNALMH